MSDAVMVPRAWLLKIVDTLKPFAEVAEKLRHCHVVEICEPHPDNPSPNIAVMPREWLERAGDDLEAAVIVLHRDGALSEGQAAKLTGLDRVEVRKLSDALAASPSVGGWEDIATLPHPKEAGLFWAAIRTCGINSPEKWEVHLIALDDETHDVHVNYYQGWDIDQYELWYPCNAPPPPSVSTSSRPQEAILPQTEKGS